MSVHSETVHALNQNLGLQLPDTVSEQEIIALLADRIVAYLDKGAEAFFQLMYRLDIPERKMQEALDKEDTPVRLATLIYERQLQKMQSRSLYKKDNTDIDPELSW